MAIHLDHIMVPARNKVAFAKLLAELLDVAWSSELEFSIGHNVSSKAEVNQVMEQAKIEAKDMDQAVELAKDSPWFIHDRMEIFEIEIGRSK